MISSKKENIAFSPYGLVSVALVLYEGSTGPSAAEIHNTLRLPWDREVTRVGFRDMHRYLKSYFSNDGFLRGLVLSKPNIMLRKNYTDLLQFYGFDVRTSPPKVPSTVAPPVLTTTKPPTTTPTPAATNPPMTTEPGKTTAVPRELESKFGTTTTETPKLLTTLTTLIEQTNTPADQTTKTVETTPTVTKSSQTFPPSTTTTTTTKPPTTTIPPSTTTPKLPPPTPTTQPTTQVPQQTTTTPPPMTKPQTTKSPDTTQSGTTLDVITMTDKKPNTPEIMSQVNMSATTTTISTTVNQVMMEGREGDADMDLETTKPTVTNQPTTLELKITTSEAPTTPSSPTTLETRDAVEVSIAETTVSKTVSMVDPNTTPMPSTVPQENITEPEKSETQPMTLIIETTTQTAAAEEATAAAEKATAAASESVIDQGTTILPEETTVLPEGLPNASGDTATVPPAVPVGPVISIVTTTLPVITPIAVATETTPPVAGATETVPPMVITTQTVPTLGVATESVPPTAVPTTLLPVTVTPLMGVIPGAPTVPLGPLQEQTNEPATTQPPTLLNAMSVEPVEMNDSEASESKNLDILSRQQRSLFSTHKTPEYHKSGSNWVPQYQDHRWGQNPSNEFWFFTFTGGENVPAHTYTAYLPFAYVPELSSLVLQLPLDDPRYSILILLPEERLGLSQLLYSLQWCPVRAIMNHLKMTAVYAVVPAFTIVKHINLVPALAKMGIHSAFDPFRADLSPMTTEPHLFVRTIEQVVTVSLRKYYASNRWFEASPNDVRQHFVANHPFAYFVLDKETEVTLMAGTIVNPVAHNQ